MTPGRSVLGHHGTSKERAAQIVENGFQPSVNIYDWVGSGSYFFENGPERAEQWARSAYAKDEACVLEAEIDLEPCLDLTDVSGTGILSQFWEDFRSHYGEERLRRARQTFYQRDIDCALINFACDQLEIQGLKVTTVRAAFEEGDYLWGDADAHSGIRLLSHVQISVRDEAAIRSVRFI